MRLDAYLARAGLASRRDARELIRRGAVRVDGQVRRSAGYHVSASEVVELGREVVRSPAADRDLVMHKPLGHACSRDPREAPLVFDLLDERLRRRAFKIAGRLDRATSGLLILTTDGGLVHRIIHPGRKVPKRYRIGFEGALAPDAVERCARGIPLAGDEAATRPAVLEVDAEDRATLVLREGRTHQVRRMMRALGVVVTSLHRDRIGALELPEGLEPGAARPLCDDELALLSIDSSL